MFAHDFVRHAYLAGTGVGLCCGVVGWFVVLRAQLFAADALSHAAFVGAVAAALAGVDEQLGLFAMTVGLAVVMGLLGHRADAGDAVIGLVFAWVLGVGLLLLALLATSSAGGEGIAAVATLFGSIYSLGAGAGAVAGATGLAVAVAVLLARRPLLLASLDSDLAAVRGVPVRRLGAGFLVAVAVLTADGTEAVGALLVLGLLAAPAGAAHRLTAHPTRGVAISAVLAVAAVWGGLALSYVVSSFPPSTAIIGLAAAAYALASLWALGRQRVAVRA
jgi:zinc/manganese transport system permease protein